MYHSVNYPFRQVPGLTLFVSTGSRILLRLLSPSSTSPAGQPSSRCSAHTAEASGFNMPLCKVLKRAVCGEFVLHNPIAHSYTFSGMVVFVLYFENRTELSTGNFLSVCQVNDHHNVNNPLNIPISKQTYRPILFIFSIRY